MTEMDLETALEYGREQAVEYPEGPWPPVLALLTRLAELPGEWESQDSYYWAAPADELREILPVRSSDTPPDQHR